MSKGSVQDFTPLFNKQEELLISVSKAKAMTKILLNQNLNTYSILEIHNCINILDDLLTEIEWHVWHCNILLKLNAENAAISKKYYEAANDDKFNE